MSLVHVNQTVGSNYKANASCVCARTSTKTLGHLLSFTMRQKLLEAIRGGASKQGREGGMQRGKEVDETPAPGVLSAASL